MCSVLQHWLGCVVLLHSGVLQSYTALSWAALWHLVTCSCTLWRNNAWSHWAAMCCNLMLCSVGLHYNMCSVGLCCDMLWHAVALCDIVIRHYIGRWCVAILCCVQLGCIATCIQLGCTATCVQLGCIATCVQLGCIATRVQLGCIATRVQLGCITTCVQLGCVATCCGMQLHFVT